MSMTPNPLTDSPRIGMGCWAIGGPLWSGETPLGYSGTDDAESARTIEAAWAAGVRVFDTAAVYGAGHSEALLGQVLGNRAGSIVVSKFGPVFDRETRQVIRRRRQPGGDPRLDRGEPGPAPARPDRRAAVPCQHPAGCPGSRSVRHARGAEGRGQDRQLRLEHRFPRTARRCRRTARASRAVEYTMNVFFDAPSQHAMAERHGLQQLIRSPLAMGLLTGKFAAGAAVASDDVRANTFDWLDYFKDGRVSEALIARLDAVRELLTSGGRTLGQGALGWLLARSPGLIPVPGAKTVAQAEENAAAMALGPLPAEVMAEIERLIDRPPEGPARER